MGVALRALLDGCIESPGWDGIGGIAAIIIKFNALKLIRKICT